jgi:Flp pilus assembly pilin Flp
VGIIKHLHLAKEPNMKATFNFISDRMYALLKEDRGAEGLEKLLIVAAIVLPLLGVLLYFKSQIGSWVEGSWKDIKENPEAGTTYSPTGGN